MQVKLGNKILHKYGISPTERPAGRLPVNIPALAPDARTQTGRGGTRRVPLVGFKETVANVTNSLVITPQPCGKIIVLQRFNLMSRLFRRAPYFTHSILWCRAYFGKLLIRLGVLNGARCNFYKGSYTTVYWCVRPSF